MRPFAQADDLSPEDSERRRSRHHATTLERLARNEELVDLIASACASSNGRRAHGRRHRRVFRTEVFQYLAARRLWSTWFSWNGERMVADDDPAFRSLQSVYLVSVVDRPRETTSRTANGAGRHEPRQQGMFLPNNLERDMATRIAPPAGRWAIPLQTSAVARFDDEVVIEGVY